MTRMTIEGPIVTQLGLAAGPVELFDGAGRLIGQFVPAPVRKWPQDQCPHSDEEIAERSRRAVQGGKKLKQMLSGLGYSQ